MPVSAPTLGTITDGGGFLLIPYTDTGSGVSNYLERSAADEYSGAFVKIVNPLPWNTGTGYFRDYSVASGKSYTYRMTAVDASTTAASATQSASLTLTRAWIHSVGIGSASTGVGGSLLTEAGTTLLFEDGTTFDIDGAVGVVPTNAALALQLTDKAPQNRAYTLESTSRVPVNSTFPIVSIGSVEKLQVSPAAYSVYGGTDRATLRSIYQSPYYSCLRDSLGNKWMGRLMPFTENYGATFAEIGLVFEVLAYAEAVS